MAESAMKLEPEQLEQIGSYVKSHIAEWLPSGLVRVDSDALARIEVDIARVKEEVKANRVILEKHIEFTASRFEQVDKRFEDLQHNMEKRFEQIDKRFEDLQHNMEKRFEQIDKRFEQVDSRFESMQHNMDKRFESMQHNMDARFESMQHNMDRRFDELHRSIRNGQWFIGLLVTFVMAASTAVQILV